MSTDINQTTVTVEENNESFMFRIPDLRDEAQLSAMVQGMIMQDSGVGNLKESQLDDTAQLAYRTLAAFNLLLEKSSAKWPWVENPQTKAPMHNPKLPPEALNVYVGFLGKLNEFFRPGVADTNTPSQPAVVTE